MNRKSLIYLCLVFCGLTFMACKKDQSAPIINSVNPVFGPAETLVTFEGLNLQDIQEVTFSGQSVNFNNAYNSDVALLFRVPSNVPLGEHVVEFRTAGGTTTSNFRVTLEAPLVFKTNPEFASPGDIVNIIGKNFFEPIRVFFFDSIEAEIVTLFPDSMEVIVPEGIEKGRVTVDANGGVAFSQVNFFSVNSILVNDFDGNGLRSETLKWGFRGQINQTAATATQNMNPDPIDGNFLKLSGKDDQDEGWIGGAQSHFGFPGDTFTVFGDFVHDVHLDGEAGWQRLSIPLNRFKNFEGFLIDPSKVKLIKIHMTDVDDSNNPLEVNVDNVKFLEIL